MNSNDTVNKHLSTLEETRLEFEPVEFFADIFKEALNELNLTNQEISLKSGWSPAMLSSVKGNTRQPSVDMLRRLVDGLHLEPYMMEVFRSALETHERLKYICSYIRSIEDELRNKRSINNLSPEAIDGWYVKHQSVINNLLDNHKRSVINTIAAFQPSPQDSEPTVKLTVRTMRELLEEIPDDFPLEIIKTGRTGVPDKIPAGGPY